MARRARPGVYVLLDRRGVVVRVGRTKDMERRRLEHQRDPLLGVYQFDERYETASDAIQRGLEQLLHDRYRPRLDLIRPISPRSPRRK